MHRLALIAFLLMLACLPLAGAETATNNNASCDVAVMPAATLLLPYFEVETVFPPFGTLTLFTITNTSPYPQIAHVTIWTDWAYPVLAFDVFLTGYDVQGISLFDVIVRGLIVPAGGGVAGTSITTVPGTTQVTATGRNSIPQSNTSNPNFVLTGERDVRTTCANLPGNIPVDLALAVKRALTSGVGANAVTSCGATQIGFNHGTLAKGYVTVDVVSYCASRFPTDRDGGYFAGPSAALLFDNVLLGDYQQLRPAPGNAAASTFDAGGSPMVHIRALPEGGLSGASGARPVATELPYTFYDRYTPNGARTADRRQPLPSVWTARAIEGGSVSFRTDLKIWREGITTGLPDCAGVGGVQFNSAIALTDIVRFDEHENSYGNAITNCVAACVVPEPSLPATSRSTTEQSPVPRILGTDIGGWLYLNLSSGARQGGVGNLPCRAVLSAQRAGLGSCNDAPPGSSGSRTTSQNWVVTSMFGDLGDDRSIRLAVEFDGAPLGNGCTPAKRAIDIIAPATHPGGSLVCPPNATPQDCSPATRPAAVNP
jgi:hypothetical protein